MSRKTNWLRVIVILGIAVAIVLLSGCATSPDTERDPGSPVWPWVILGVSAVAVTAAVIAGDGPTRDTDSPTYHCDDNLGGGSTCTPYN